LLYATAFAITPLRYLRWRCCREFDVYCHFDVFTTFKDIVSYCAMSRIDICMSFVYALAFHICRGSHVAFAEILLAPLLMMPLFGTLFMLIAVVAGLRCERRRPKIFCCFSLC